MAIHSTVKSRKLCNRVLTSNQGESAQAGEGADIDLQEVEGFAEVENAV